MLEVPVELPPVDPPAPLEAEPPPEALPPAPLPPPAPWAKAAAGVIVKRAASKVEDVREAIVVLPFRKGQYFAKLFCSNGSRPARLGR